MGLHESRGELSKWGVAHRVRAETAAAYCDEPSVEAFLLKVKRGYYTFSERGILPKWHRAKLDEAIALRHGLMPAGGMLAENVAELI